MTHYFIRHVHVPDEGKYLVAKMDDDFNVLDTYNMVLNKYHEVCNCPAYKTPCKHLRYLKEWLAQPIEVRDQMHFNDKAGDVGLWELAPEGLKPVDPEEIADASERYLDKTKGGP